MLERHHRDLHNIIRNVANWHGKVLKMRFSIKLLKKMKLAFKSFFRKREQIRYPELVTKLPREIKEFFLLPLL